MNQKLLVLFLILFSIEAYAYQTIKIAALRVEFVEDSNELTTGNGTFATDSVTTDPFAIDPAPHNRTYFKDQLIAADRYFQNVSSGKVRISGDVYPRGLNDAYMLPNEMKSYNPNTSQSEIDKGIARLFSDAIQAADTDPDLDFSKYDLVIIFHAGVGRDIDLGFDETPQDIASLFVTEQYLKNNLDPAFSGISVDGGNTLIKQGVILPETENQQDVQVALTGILVSNIGSYLGLYDLFSPSEQRSGIGKFGLMDVGLFNVNGLIPSPPSAFSRKLLGWAEPEIIMNTASAVSISRFGESNSEPELIEIPINEDEYYLLEYRGNHKDNIDSLLFELSEGRNEFPGYLEVLKTYFSDRIEISDSSGVLLSVDDYDIGLAGAGILIWHIDESVIRNAAGGAVNDNPDWRAVDLEEADGSQDIGQAYSLLDAGYQSELGTLLDFWYKDNEAPLFTNEFSSLSTPGTFSNLNRAQTGIVISHFSGNSSRFMTFDFARGYFKEGFPVETNINASKTYTIAGTPEGFDTNFIFTVSDDGFILAAGSNGKGLFYPEKNILARISSDGNGEMSIALADTNNNSKYDLLFALSGSQLYGFDLTKVTADSLAENIFTTTDLTTAQSEIIVSEKHIFYFDGLNIYNYSFSGNPTGLELTQQNLKDLIIENITPVQTGIDGDFIAAIPGNKIIIVSNEDDLEAGKAIFSIYDTQQEKVISTFPAEHVAGQFALADVDQNGTVDVVYLSGNELIARNLSGSFVLNFPLQIDLNEGEKLVGTPAIIDHDGTGSVFIYVTTSRGRIIGVDHEAKMLPLLPFSAGGERTESAVILQLDDDPGLEIATVSNKGVISAWTLPQTDSASEIIWGMSNLSPDNNSIFLKQYASVNIGGDLVPEKRFFNYPNPNEGDKTTIRYYLNESADVKLRMFDASGFKVDELNGTGLADTDNEVVWNVSDVASGVYICQIEAKSETKTERRLIKILVVH